METKENSKREIKFRIWDKSSKIFRGNLYKYLINAHTGELEVWGFSDIYDEWYNTYDDKDLIVQQYTGLQDRNGVKVYEGDIISFRPISNKPPFYEVRYDLERGCFLPYYTKGKYFVYIDDDYPEFLYSEKIRVIGNIFENPELLK